MSWRWHSTTSFGSFSFLQHPLSSTESATLTTSIAPLASCFPELCDLVITLLLRSTQ